MNLPQEPSLTPRRTVVLVAVSLFVISFLLRWPSCGASFWLDELHTTWCTFGPLGQVSERSAIGNQQPMYFTALWFWQRIPPTALINFYGIEAWLRLTSVLACSAAASAVYVTVRFAMNSHVGGIAAGMALALDSSSLFYGTELRPYACVILCSALAVGLASMPVTPLARWGLHLALAYWRRQLI